tara:strand:- start:108 stop:506 length:399 start_codon:yes stop_codon:yes gene_type:complete
MSDEISQEDIDEVVQDRYRIFSLANGQIVIGKIISTTQFGMMIKNPVIADLEDSQINFTIMFNGMSRSRSFFFGVGSIMTIGLVDEDIKKYYDDYIAETDEEVDRLKEAVRTENTANVVLNLLKSLNTETIH